MKQTHKHQFPLFTPSPTFMQVFHWGRPVGNYAFFESLEQCLQGRLYFPGLSERVSEFSNMFEISTIVADPCNRS